jgi:hypothetical protein
MKPVLFRTLLLALLVAISGTASAQELNCKFKILHEKIVGVDPQFFRGMERAITDFINTRKWTTDDYGQQERIDCNMLLNITARSDKDQDLYTATLNIQATRPVYNASYTTPLINTIDRDLVFRYSQFNTLTFDDNRITGPDPLASNLTATLAYYCYLILGLDYDSFSPSGGTAMFKKAQNVVNNAPEEGGIKGWKAFEDKRNRYWIVDQLLNPRFTSYRSAWYSYHREGLDIMYNKPSEGRNKVLAALNVLQTLLRDNQQSSLVQQTFFNAKSDEVTRIVLQGTREERTQYFTMLSVIDANNAQKYNALKQ